MRFFPDERLYSDTARCLEFLRRIDDESVGAAEAQERYHLYWYGQLSAKVAFSIKSFLATQSPARSELWLWLDAESGYEGHADDPLLQPLLPFVTVRSFDAKTEARETPLVGRRALYRGRLARRSDFVRFVVLSKHGGTYLDADMMCLRDLGVLSGDTLSAREFCYRWSASEPYGNSAALRLEPQSASTACLMARCAAGESCHPRDVLRFDVDEELDLLVLPCVFFDPLWPHHDRKDRFSRAPYDRFDDFFRPFGGSFRPDRRIRSYRDFFPGALTYHWHNLWDAPEHRDSYFGLFNEEFDEILRERLRRP